MRQKDHIKEEALFKATVQTVNELGLASSSVSKIAKAAGISPATLYIYYENKDDLLISTYLHIKGIMGEFLCRSLQADDPIRDSFHTIWHNFFAFVSEQPDLFLFTQQFSQSPYMNNIKAEEAERSFSPVIELLKRGISRKVIKDVPLDLINAFTFHPVYSLANDRLCHGFKATDDNIETAFQMAWDAVKL